MHEMPGDLQQQDAELHNNIHVLCRRTNSMLDDVDALEASQAHNARLINTGSIMGSASGAMAKDVSLRNAGVLPGREWRKVKDDLAGVLEGLEAVHQNVKMELLRQTDAKAMQCGGMIYGMQNDILTSQKSESTTGDWPPIPFEVYANVRKTDANDDSIWQVVGGMYISKDDWVIIIRQNDKFQRIDQSDIDDVASDDDVDPESAREFAYSDQESQ